MYTEREIPAEHFDKKSLKNLFYLNLKWDFTDQTKMARKCHLSLVFWL
jgi:hypothetical protein